MKHIDAHEWGMLKQQTATHLNDPHWLGGAYCISDLDVRGRVHLPDVPWNVTVVTRARGNRPD